MSSGKRKKVKLWFASILIMVIIAEILLQFLYFFAGMNIDIRFYYYYKNKEWGEAYFKEDQEITWKFVPFIQWRAEKYRGEYINIDAQGVRRTWNAKNLQGHQDNSIFLFGGSTMWGEGARDDYTIPSQLAKHLHSQGNKCFVINYGENAFTFPQEVIYLILLLRSGQKPSHVIFYDGANDVYAAYQSGEPGTIQNIRKIRKKLEYRSLPLVWSVVVDVFQRRCMLYVTMNKLSAGLFHKPRFSEVGACYDDSQLKSLAVRTVEEYLTSKNFLEQLSKMYGFHYYCFWQPVIYNEEHVLPADGKGDPRLDDKALKKLHHYTIDYLKSQSIPHFYNISEALNKRTEAYYFDDVHINETGNQVIAERIYRILKPDLDIPLAKTK